MRVFQRDVSAPDKDHALGFAFKPQDAFVRQIANGTKSGYRGDRSSCAGGDEDLRPSDMFIGGFKRMVIGEAAFPVYEIEIPVPLERLLYGVPSFGDDAFHPLHDRAKIHFTFMRTNAESLIFQGLHESVRSGDERFRRHTAIVDTGHPDDALVDQCDLQSI